MTIIKRVLLLTVAVPLALVAVSLFWTTHDYGLRCKRCLHYKHVIVQRFAGIPFWRSTTEVPGGEDAYLRLFGRACEHDFHKGGTGDSNHFLFVLGSVACGEYGEAGLFESRDMALSAAFDAEHRISDRDLALASFSLIEWLVPADTKFSNRSAIPPTAHRVLYRFSEYLKSAKTAQEWKQCLDYAEHDFVGAPPTPSA